MKKQYLLSLSVFILATAILTISVMRSATVSYVFVTPAPAVTVLGTESPDIGYKLPYPGSILPDSPLWVIKALRDKVWYMVTTNPLKKAELALLFSDKRLSSAVSLFDSNKAGLALSTLSKGEKYLEIAVNEEQIARKEGMDTSAFLTKLALSSLKHRQIIEEKILPLAPEQAKPYVIKIENFSKNSYDSSRDGLNDKGITPPIDPFDGQ